MHESMKANHTTALTVTSQNPALLETMRSQTKFTGEMIADPENTIAAKLKATYGLEVAISEKKDYPHGMAQPAVIVLKNDGEVLYKWAIVPAMVSDSLAERFIAQQDADHECFIDESRRSKGPAIPD
jgi:peroxiredoxin